MIRLCFGLYYKVKCRFCSVVLKMYCVIYYIYCISAIVNMFVIASAPEICTFAVVCRGS